MPVAVVTDSTASLPAAAGVAVGGLAMAAVWAEGIPSARVSSSWVCAST